MNGAKALSKQFPPFDGHGVETYISFTHIDGKTGKVKKVETFPGKSFVKNFLSMIYAYGIATSQTLNNTTGTTSIFTISSTSDYPNASAGGGVDTYGIQVGTGSTAASPNDAALGTKIAHGNGAGQLIYGATATGGAFQTTGTDNILVMIRAFTNYSGGSITINEVGIAVGNAVTPARFWLIARDVPTSQAIANGDVLVVSITIKTTG